jgi:hypothetical protein
VTVLLPLSPSAALSAFAKMVDTLLASSSEEVAREKAEYQKLAAQRVGEASTAQVSRRTAPR